ncbi:MAG: glycerophosphodiester phosphodiesterase [Gaiellaceae bacterium]
MIGHRGLPTLAPENTLRSFELALEHGADGFEVDAVALSDGTLLAGHSLDLAELCHGAAHGSTGARRLDELRRLDPELATLEQVLELAAARLGSGLLLIDLKSEGRESALVEALRRHGLQERTFLCSLERPQLARLRELAPEIARSLSYPADRRRLSERRPIAPFVPLALVALRLRLRRRIRRWLEQTGATAVTLHHDVIDAELVRSCHEWGIAVLAWTVDEASVRQRLMEVGVDAIITNDPRPSARKNDEI